MDASKPEFELRDVVYALIWESDWAGDVPGSQIVAASWLRAELEEDDGKTTYDGVSARTRGSFRIHTLRMPALVRGAVAKGGAFNVTNDPTMPEVGCWFDGKPWAKFFDHKAAFPWMWPSEVHRYLEACRLASGFPNVHGG